MVLGSDQKLFGFLGAGLLVGAGALPIGCGDDRFSGCEASRTCPPADTGGEAGAGSQTGGSSAGGSAGRGGSSGSSTGDGGEDDTTAGGRAGAPSEGGNGGSAGEGDGGDRGEEPPDTTQPTIISIMPADGAVGVRANANIVVTFSEPMDRVTTQAAYQSADVPSAGVTFAWSSDSTVLTINPIADLPYAEGTAPSSPARQFAILITDTAEDLAGNRLRPTTAWRFSTLRRITQTVTSSGNWWVDYMSNVEGCEENAGIGDDGRGGLLAVVAFDLTDVPAEIVDWESAVLAGRQIGVQGSPYGSTGLGALRAYSMGAVEPSAITFGTPVVLDLGVFSVASSAGLRMIGALEAVFSDYADRLNRGQRSVYRLSFERDRTSDTIRDQALFECTFTLTLSYIII